MDVNKDFALQADSMADASLLLPEIINDGIRLLVYAGNAGRSSLSQFSGKFYC